MWLMQLQLLHTSQVGSYESYKRQEKTNTHTYCDLLNVKMFPVLQVLSRGEYWEYFALNVLDSTYITSVVTVGQKSI